MPCYDPEAVGANLGYVVLLVWFDLELTVWRTVVCNIRYGLRILASDPRYINIKLTCPLVLLFRPSPVVQRAVAAVERVAAVGTIFLAAAS